VSLRILSAELTVGLCENAQTVVSRSPTFATKYDKLKSVENGAVSGS